MNIHILGVEKYVTLFCEYFKINDAILIVPFCNLLFCPTVHFGDSSTSEHRPASHGRQAVLLGVELPQRLCLIPCRWCLTFLQLHESSENILDLRRILSGLRAHEVFPEAELKTAFS